MDKKKKTDRIMKILLLVVGLLIIVVLAVAAVQLDSFMKNKKSEIQEETQAVAEATPPETTTEEIIDNVGGVAPSEEGTTHVDYKKYIWVGDSRYVGMQIYQQEDDVFLSKSEMGYEYLLEQQSAIAAEVTPDSVVIVGLGVNDMYLGTDGYATTVNYMADTLGCQVCYMLVNPVDEIAEQVTSYHVLNQTVDRFNEEIVTKLSSAVKVIDTNSYLWTQNFQTIDGLHYTNETYKLIYDYIRSELS